MNNLRSLLAGARRGMVNALYRGNAVNALQHANEQRIVDSFVQSDVGADYGVTSADKARLVDQMRRVSAHVQSATDWTYHVVLAGQILSVPPETEGAVVECGCFKGASTSSLSLVCERIGRKLYVCDSFEGLPEDDGSVHSYPHFQAHGYYEKGMYAGALEEVQENIRQYGALEPCAFVKGYFCDTLADVPGPLAFVFVDVDLVSSMRDCIVHLWPKLIDNGYFYTDDSCDMAVVQLWFDSPWWSDHLGESSPGYVGSGCGLPIAAGNCTLGYAHKVADPTASYQRMPWLRYPDEDQESPS
ncbi:MAG: hypothetical protein GY851_23360 [bacterium]|nr:hypothetical protein [bacterium]